jgi:Holliday junction resolvasome RuvABC endonuclease subunit
MTGSLHNDTRVMGVDPSSRGFGYVILEGPHQLIDWGVKQTRTNKNARTVVEVRALLDQYYPDILVVEEYCAGPGSRRSSRVCMLQNDLAALTGELKVGWRAYPWERVRDVFARFGDTTKHGIACVVARLYPELHHRLPPPRKLWMSEDYRMSMFDATALAITHFMAEELRLPRR